MGASAARELARSGASVVVVDQASTPNPRAASVDHSKVFRFAYPDALYAGLAVEAGKLWRLLEEETAGPLMTRTGVLMLGTNRASAESESYETLRSLGLEVELLESPEVALRFPQLNPEAFTYGVYDPSGALLHAGRALRATLDLARRYGATVIERERAIEIRQAEESRVAILTEAGRKLVSDRALVACGPWTRTVLPLLNRSLVTTRQEVVYFEPGAHKAAAFHPGGFPIFIELESGYYGFPIHHAGAMKIANHHKGKPASPDPNEPPVGEDFIAGCRAFFSRFIPALEDAEVRQSLVCYYNNTPDDDFLIDWHPSIENLLLATGFSGHGFKFGPVIGRISAELLLAGRTSFDIERFSLARLGRLVEVSE
jgi:monomeric sarcosine oxidase